MTRAGVLVDDVIPCTGLSSGVAADHLVRIVSGGGVYQAVRVGPDRLQFARTFRPTWATVSGWLGLLVFFIGIAFFFVKTTEACVAVIEEDHRGTRIRLSGTLDRDVLAQLRVAFTDPAAAAAAVVAAGAVGAPVASAYERATPDRSNGAFGELQARPAPVVPISSVPSVNGTAPPAPRSAPAADVPPPAPAWSVQAADVGGLRQHHDPVVPVRRQAEPAVGPIVDMDGDLPDATRIVARGSGSDAPPNAPLLLQLDDGRWLPIERLLLVGRDPAARPEESGAELVSVDDLSVSKTHVAITSDGGSVRLMDRNSTNGTQLVDPFGRQEELRPGEWVDLAPGMSIKLGERTLRVVSARSRAEDVG